MDSEIRNTLLIITKNIYIYLGITLITLGLIGNSLNIIIFTTLRTFRETPCTLYFTIASVTNIFHLLTTTLLSTLNNGFEINFFTRGWLCKIRFAVAQWFSLLSLTTTCFAIAAQYFSMTRPTLNNSKWVRAQLLIAVGVWFAHGIPFIIYFDNYLGRCLIVNIDFARYYSDFFVPVLLGALPIFVMILFALLAFKNARSLASRQLHIAQSSRDRQLTAMVLVQVIFTVAISLPFLIIYTYSLILVDEDPILQAKFALARGITYLCYSSIYAGPFYIYVCVSERFRKQFKHVVFYIYWTRWYQHGLRRHKNQIVPYELDTVVNRSIQQ